MINEFIPIAKALIGLKDLKIISFGPRPLNFMACNAPIAQLYKLGVEIEENSELDLFEAFNNHAGDERIPEVVADMEKELGEMCIRDRKHTCPQHQIGSHNMNILLRHVEIVYIEIFSKPVVFERAVRKGGNKPLTVIFRIFRKGNVLPVDVYKRQR